MSGHELMARTIAAHRSGLTHVVLPQRNEDDLDDVPEQVRDEMTFHTPATIAEVLDLALEPRVPA